MSTIHLLHRTTKGPMAGKSMGSGNYSSFNVGSTGGLMQGSVDDLFARAINNLLKAWFLFLIIVLFFLSCFEVEMPISNQSWTEIWGLLHWVWVHWQGLFLLLCDCELICTTPCLLFFALQYQPWVYQAKLWIAVEWALHRAAFFVEGCPRW